MIGQNPTNHRCQDPDGIPIWNSILQNYFAPLQLQIKRQFRIIPTIFIIQDHCLLIEEG